jgi:DNA-binding IclR family transcriptional regulator
LAKKGRSNPASEDRQFVTALAKGLQILQCFTPATPELGASELARMTGMPQPTVWRLCYTLIRLGFLVAVPGRQSMRPGIPLLGLGHAVLADLSIGELALPDMQSIASRYEGAVSLGARDGLNVIYLQRCQGSAIILADLKVGSRVPMATSATGWAYLAGLEVAERNKLMAELSASLGKQWSVIEPRLSTALRNFEKQGYIVNKGSLHPRINSVAVPVKSPDSSTILSISSGGISEVFTSETLARIGAELKILAAKLGPLLAYQRKS